MVQSFLCSLGHSFVHLFVRSFIHSFRLTLLNYCCLADLVPWQHRRQSVWLHISVWASLPFDSTAEVRAASRRSALETVYPEGNV